MEIIPIRHINDTLKEPAFSGSFDIVDIHEYLSGKEMVQELHRHSFYYILVLEKGAGEHQIDFITYPIQDNCLFLMRPGQVHEIVIARESTGYLLKFSKDFYTPVEVSAKQVLRKVSNKNFWMLEKEEMKGILLTLSKLFEENKEKKERYKQAIQSYLDVFFIGLLRAQPDKNIVHESNHYMQERLEEFQELVRLSATQHKTVSYYAEQLNLSPYQLNAITKSTLDKTCTEVITDHLLLEAKRYLLAGSSQVTQIAWNLGYEDVSYFVRFFKKHTGYSPEAFRKDFK